MLLLTYAPTKIVKHLNPVELDALYWKAVAHKLDVHRVVACHLFDVPYRWVTHFQRTTAKTLMFTYIYDPKHFRRDVPGRSEETLSFMQEHFAEELNAMFSRPTTGRISRPDPVVMLEMSSKEMCERFARAFDYSAIEKRVLGHMTSVGRLNITQPSLQKVTKKVPHLLSAVLKRMKV